MLKIIPGATGYFNKTLNSNQFDNEDAIKGKVNSIYPKTFSPVESITRCAISPRVGVLKLILTDFARLLTQL